MTLKDPVAIDVVRRTFQVLECLNRSRTMTLHHLHEETGLPKVTLSRLLETLSTLGYTEQVSKAVGHRITTRVKNLSSGLRFTDHLVDVAIPHLRKFTQAHGWPVYLAQISDGIVHTRYTTSTESPLSFEDTFYNLPLRAVDIAIGRVLLAYATEAERSAVLLQLGLLGETDAEEARELRKFEAIFEQIRHVGYAATPRETRRRMLGIAVPLLHQSLPIGGLSIRFPRSVMSGKVAAAKFLLPLQQVARIIVEQALPSGINET